MQYSYITNSKFLNDLYCVKQSDINKRYQSNSYNLCNPCKSYCNVYDPNKPYTNCLNELGIAISYICLNEFEHFFNKPNVIGVGLGFKQIRGCSTKQQCITVYVTKKLPCYALPLSAMVESLYKGIPTDVIESGVFQDFRSLKDRIRPTVGGCSISASIGSLTGSLGCLAQDISNLYILTCNHIIANYNKTPLDTPVIQPGRQDGGKAPDDTVANLAKFVPLLPINPLLPWAQQPKNIVDAAIAKVSNPDLTSPIIAIVNRPPQGIIGPVLDLPIKKVGINTELTQGVITSVNTTIQVGNYLYTKQIISNLKSVPGDSGALVLDDKDRAVGLLKAGTNLTSIISPIIDILQLLNISLVTN